jgi:type II secretory pathway predicted ATPase ExeA
MSSYFSFTREPFSRELAPHEVFVTRGHQELIARLRHAISTCAGTADRDIGSLAVITGQVGCGQSPTIRSFVPTLDPPKYRSIYLARSGRSPPEVYPWLPCRHR